MDYQRLRRRLDALRQPDTRIVELEDFTRIYNSCLDDVNRVVNYVDFEDTMEASERLDATISESEQRVLDGNR